jgi:hypothetical protein
LCGKNFEYNLSDDSIKAYISQGRWDFGDKEVKNCGNSTCQDFDYERDDILKKRSEIKFKEEQEKMLAYRKFMSVMDI